MISSSSDNRVKRAIASDSGDSGTRATRAELELQNDAEATPALGLLGLSLSYEMMEGLLLFKF